MGDTYNIKGQVGAVGPHATAQGNTFHQQNIEGGDLLRLAEELAVLKATLIEEASAVGEDEAVAAISRAEQSARDGNGPQALEHLKASGRWAFDVATKIGTAVAAKAIQSGMGL